MTTFKFKKGFFLASKGLYANVVSMLDEKNDLIRFTGTSKVLVEDIYATATVEKLLERLAALHPDQNQKSLEDFLNRFLDDVKKLDFIEHT